MWLVRDTCSSFKLKYSSESIPILCLYPLHLHYLTLFFTRTLKVAPKKGEKSNAILREKTEKNKTKQDQELASLLLPFIRYSRCNRTLIDSFCSLAMAREDTEEWTFMEVAVVKRQLAESNSRMCFILLRDVIFFLI